MVDNNPAVGYRGATAQNRLVTKRHSIGELRGTMASLALTDAAAAFSATKPCHPSRPPRAVADRAWLPIG